MDDLFVTRLTFVFCFLLSLGCLAFNFAETMHILLADYLYPFFPLLHTFTLVSVSSSLNCAFICLSVCQMSFLPICVVPEKKSNNPLTTLPFHIINISYMLAVCGVVLRLCGVTLLM